MQAKYFQTQIKMPDGRFLLLPLRIGRILKEKKRLFIDSRCSDRFLRVLLSKVEECLLNLDESP